MIDYLSFFPLLLVASLWCFGIYIACQYDKEVKQEVTEDGWLERHVLSNKMVLWWFGYGAEFLPWYLNKPLCKCVSCMASIHGSAIFLLFYPWEVSLVELIPIWILFVGCLAGLNQLIANRFLDE